MLRLIVPPDPIVTPGDVPGGHAPNDATVAAFIEAVTQTFDAPTGWVGRAFGEQTLELSGSSFTSLVGCDGGIPLPYRPIIGIEAITYLDADGGEQDVPDEYWHLAGDKLWLVSGYSWPSVGSYPDAARIRYQAGYNGVSPVDGGTGDVPEMVRQAIILSAQHLTHMTGQSPFLSVDEVEGIGRRQYTVSENASKLIDTTCQRLLGNLWVPVA